MISPVIKVNNVFPSFTYPTPVMTQYPPASDILSRKDGQLLMPGNSTKNELYLIQIFPAETIFGTE